MAHNEEEVAQEILPSFECPINYDLMHDPVLCADGHTYERASIEEWIAQSRTRGQPCVSPQTGWCVLLVLLGSLHGTCEQFYAALRFGEPLVGIHFAHSLVLPSRATHDRLGCAAKSRPSTSD